jgi:hypothetical protein
MFFRIALALSSVLPLTAAPVVANNSLLTYLGDFAAGTYLLSASGVVSLAGAVGSGFDIRPDGTPDSTVTFPGYGYFNPDGSSFDVGSGQYGPGGVSLKLGALIGSLTASPSTSDFFLIGYGTTLTFAAKSSVYALVNDTFYSNNAGQFDITVSLQPTAVPEPSSALLALTALALCAARRAIIKMV